MGSAQDERTAPGLRDWLTRSRARVVAVLALLLLSATAVVASAAGALPAKAPARSLLASPDGNGYAIVDAAGKQYDYGSSHFTGQLADSVDLAAPIVAAVDVPGGRGSWLAGRDGALFAVGGAPFYGSLAGAASDPRVVSIVATPTGHGYWLATAAGDVVGFGDARSFGSAANLPHAGDVTAMAATPSGGGYWLATSGGSVLAFGDAPALGTPLESAPGRAAAGQAGGKVSPVVALLSSTSGRGYLAVASDGTTYAYGDYADPGSFGGMHLTSPVVAAAPFSSGAGVWLLTRNGGVLALHAPFYGSAADAADPHPRRVVAPIYRPTGATADGAAGGLVVLPCQGADGMLVVNALIARQVSELLTAAGRDGIGLCATSSFRNSQQQIALRQAYCVGGAFDPKASCSRPVALPGRSLHEQGLAIDFSSSPGGYDWLATHAASYGLHHLAAFGPQTEPWHYSSTGG